MRGSPPATQRPPLRLPGAHVPRLPPPVPPFAAHQPMAQERVVMLERERAEREAQERMQYERCPPPHVPYDSPPPHLLL